MAARKRKLTLDENWRKRIQAGVIMDRLLKCINGDIEMSAQQIKAADIILKKIEPDLARTELQPLGQDGKPTGWAVRVTHVKASKHSAT